MKKNIQPPFQHDLKAPFPWFGGKRRVADIVWRHFGDVSNYVEPFAGSLAVLLCRPTAPGTETVNDADCYICVSPETRVLMADLTWRPAGCLEHGDSLLAFDESNPGDARPGLRSPTKYRRWRLSNVIAAPRVYRPCYRLTFDDGTSVVASEDHCWLSGSHKTGSGGRGWRWVKTKSLVCNRATQRSWVLNPVEVTEQLTTWDAGWIAGVFDGEGSVRSSPSARIVVSQNPGPVLDKIEQWLISNGFDFERNASKKCVTIALRGGLKEQMRFLMLVRPMRLLRKFQEVIPECSLYARTHSAVGLVAKEYIGNHEVIALSTSTRTFIAEGLASHNCNFWRALSHDPEQVASFADWPVNEADLQARHKWLIEQEAFRARMKADPDYYDVKIAGWWVWGLCAWIGGGWCHAESAQLPHLGSAGMGINRRLPHLGNAGMGINRKHRGDAERDLAAYFEQLAARLRRVRVTCGDWSRVTGDSVTICHGITGVFLDPPYASARNISYAVDSTTVAHDVREWAIANGDNPMLRIALCGYEGEHAMPESWHVVEWKANGGYGSQSSNQARENSAKERIWFSPHCIFSTEQQLRLF